MIAFDASFLILVFDEEAASKQGIPRLTERLDVLLEDLRKARTKIVIPTPALSELLAKADYSLLDEINSQAVFRVAAFDMRAAVEAAELTKRSVKQSDKKDPVVNATWSKIKFDRQIVAIAKVEGVEAIYSTDPDVGKHARQVGITCLGIADLPKAPSIQQTLPLGQADERTKQQEGVTPITQSSDISGSRERSSQDQTAPEGEEEGKSHKTIQGEGT